MVKSLELELIEFIKKRVPTSKNLVVGIGDDCAIWRIPNGYEEVISFDLLIEGIHFDFKFTSVRDLAWRAVARGLSDIAACGAKPKFCLLGLGLPKNTSEKQAKLFVSEFIKALRQYGTKLVGGDISEADKWTIGITVIGFQKRGLVLLRSTASPDSHLFITGQTGLAIAGLEILKNYPDLVIKFPSLVKSYLMPKPKISEGLFLATRKIATSAIDISDGLLLDAWRLAESSEVAIVIEKEKIPIAQSLRRFCELVGKSPDEFISAGDDYELLFTVPPRKIDKFRKIKQLFHEIGYTKKGRGVFVQDKTGGLVIAPKEGYLHLKR